MEIKAKLNYLTIAPRKVRLLTIHICGMDVKSAENHLKFISNRASGSLLKLIKSAVANAENNFKLDKNNLYIKQIAVNEGTPFKRWRPVSRGRAHPIMKRTSNIRLVLSAKKAVVSKKPKEEISEKIEDIKKRTIVKPSKVSRIRAPKEIKKRTGIRGITKKIFRRKSF